eukprot:15359617-Ditylum_brightwellii.AAC.2
MPPTWGGHVLQGSMASTCTRQGDLWNPDMEANLKLLNFHFSWDIVRLQGWCPSTACKEDISGKEIH